MIEVQITEKMKRTAQRKARQMGTLYNSITRGDGNIVGFLGEQVANTILKGKSNNTYDYDLVKDDVKFDVKTKRCTSEPKEHYDCSISNYNPKQECDYYIFVRVEQIKGVWGRAWVLGYLSKKEYFEKAREMKRGEWDRSNGFLVKADCWNVAISELNDPNDLYTFKGK